jgi:hypothetical protein
MKRWWTRCDTMIAMTSSDRLEAVVVARCDEHRLLRLVQRPAGERARRFFDVVLGVRAQAEREELHHFARVVFVRMRLVVRAIVEPDQHRRIAGHRRQQRRKPPEPLLPEQIDLRDHLRRLHLLQRRREMAVPEQRHLFVQRVRRAQHPVEPPQLRRLPVLLGIVQQRGVGVVGEARVRSRRMEQRIDRARRPERAEPRHVDLVAAEAGAP